MGDGRLVKRVGRSRPPGEDGAPDAFFDDPFDQQALRTKGALHPFDGIFKETAGDEQAALRERAGDVRQTGARDEA